MENQRILAQKYNQETFYKLYKFLFTDDHFKQMSDSAKIAYSLFRDRFNLSIENNWVDKNGHIYLYFTITEICEILGCANQKATKLKRELKAFGLLEEERVGFNKPNKIYMLEPKFDKEFSKSTDETRNSDYHDTDVRNSSVGNHENHNSRIVTIMNQESCKSQPNKTDINKTDTNKTNDNNLHYLNNLHHLQADTEQAKTSDTSNSSDSLKHVEEKIKDKDLKDFTFNKYPERIRLELSKLDFEDAKKMMDITNKAKRAVAKEYDDMKKESIDFSYETHEYKISSILCRMILKSKMDNLSVESLSRYISRSIQNYYRDYADKEIEEMVERDMSSTDIDKFFTNLLER